MGLRRSMTTLAGVAVAMLLWSCDSDTSRVDKGDPRPTPIVNDVVMPASWGGQWNLVITFRDCNSGHIVTIEDVVDTICAGDTLRLSLSPILSGCDGLIDDHRIDAGCEYTFSALGCGATVSMLLNLDRDGDMITGTGVWTVEMDGPCVLEYQPGCERIEVTGTRLNSSPAPCDPGAIGLLEGVAARARLLVSGRGGVR